MATRTLACTLGALLVICQHGAVGAVAPGLQDDEAVSTLTAVRTAIRGDTRSAMGVESLTLVGSRTGRSRATGMVNPPAPFEIRVLLPDHYVRISTNVLIRSWNGFRGDVRLRKRFPRSADVRMSPAPVLSPENEAALLRTQKERFTALVLGLLAEMPGPLSLEIRGMSRIGEIVSIRFRGAEEFVAVLDVDTTTGLPVHVRHDTDLRFPRLAEQRQNASSAGARGGRVVTMPPLERMEVMWTFEEWRAVENGLRLPHRITFSARGVMLEEYRIETVEINQLSMADFNP